MISQGIFPRLVLLRGETLIQPYGASSSKASLSVRSFHNLFPSSQRYFDVSTNIMDKTKEVNNYQGNIIFSWSFFMEFFMEFYGVMEFFMRF